MDEGTEHVTSHVWGHQIVITPGWLASEFAIEHPMIDVEVPADDTIF